MANFLWNKVEEDCRGASAIRNPLAPGDQGDLVTVGPGLAVPELDSASKPRSSTDASVLQRGLLSPPVSTGGAGNRVMARQATPLQAAAPGPSPSCTQWSYTYCSETGPPLPSRPGRLLKPCSLRGRGLRGPAPEPAAQGTRVQPGRQTHTAEYSMGVSG